MTVFGEQNIQMSKVDLREKYNERNMNIWAI